MRTSGRTKVVGAVAGFIVFAVGVWWLLVRGPEPFGTILTVFGAGLAASLLVSPWIYRPQD